MSERHDGEGRQVVGIDLHRRRSVLVRMDAGTGETLEQIRVNNDPEAFRAVIGRAGEAPEVVLEATYGWCWAADVLADAGANVHLAHPLGVAMFGLRRVKNDVRDASDLADLLRLGRLPEAWIAPPEVREVRELVRHRAKLVAIRSNLKCQVHGVLANAGVAVPMTDLFGVEGMDLLAKLRAQHRLSDPAQWRVTSTLRILDLLDGEIVRFEALCRARLGADPGFRAVQQIPGVGRVLGAVFVAEIGDVHRFARAAQLTSWAGLTPRHHESDRTVHRGSITKQGSKLVRWAAIEAVQILPKTSYCGAIRHQVGDRRGRNIGTVAAARELLECVYYALRDGHVRRLTRRPAA